MRVAVFGSKSYDESSFRRLNAELGSPHEFTFLEPRLTAATAPLAAGHPGACVFVNDAVTAEVLETLRAGGTKHLALRCAGFNQVDLEAAARIGVDVVRVPAYSPYAVAEHAVGLMLTLNRRIHRAYNRVREGNFALDGLLGFDMHGKTVGVVGTGKIGELVCTILAGFGCKLLAYDVRPNPACEKLGVQYLPLSEVLSASDVVTLHCPLLPSTKHLVNAASLAGMKKGVMIVNTSRGALINARDAIHALKTGRIGYLALDVYEEEADLFFEDHSDELLADDVFARLLTFPNVLVTGHQAYFTQEALSNIAETTLRNLSDLEAGRPCPNAVKG